MTTGMTMLQILFFLPTLTLGFLMAIILIYRFKTSRVRQLVDQLPGPKPYFPLGNMWTFVTAKRHEIFPRSRAIAGPYLENEIFRLWIAFLPQIYILKASAVEVILGSSKHIEKSYLYTFLHCWLGTGLLTSTGDKWRSHRKLITPSFHFRILENFVSVFNEQADILVDILQQFEDKGQFDIHPYLSRCTLDVIVESAMGVQTIKAQTDAVSEYVNAVDSLTEVIGRRLLSPWLAPNVIFNLTSYGRTQAKCLRILHGFTKKVIKERRAEYLDSKKWTEESDDEGGIYNRKRRLAFLDMLLESTCDGHKLTDNEVAEEVDTFMFEGHDTTAAAASWILYNIGRLPEIQKKVHQELNDIFGNSDRPISSEDLHKMKYLERVIKESLRLFPSVPLFARTSSEDIHIGKYTLPAGVEILLSTYYIHRDPENFPDPEKFDPDRFLPEISASRHPYAYIPFSAGPRNCIGQKFAMMEEKIIVSKILRRFRITSKQSLAELKMSVEFILRPLDGMWMKLKKRPKILN